MDDLERRLWDAFVRTGDIGFYIMRNVVREDKKR